MSRSIVLLAVAGAYVGTAEIGISLSVAHGVITPVWAPSGIALAAVLIFGFRVWPAVALGALVANATSGAGLEVAAWIAVGNTLEPLLGGYLLRRAGIRLGSTSWAPPRARCWSARSRPGGRSSGPCRSRRRPRRVACS